MGLLGELTVRLNTDVSKFTAGFTQATSTVDIWEDAIVRDVESVSKETENGAKQVDKSTKKIGKSFKDITRIAQGIVVAQTFYKIVNAIEGSVSAMSHFMSMTERTRVSLSIMMKDAEKGGRLLNALADFAADTPLTFEQAATNARKLLAYNFNGSNLLNIMNTLADASTASGNTETFDSVAKALGQINTKGRLAAQEMLQLTEAGIPAYEILREKLHLTSDELAEIGKQRIPADVAINAILEGMQERYGGAAEAMSNTVNGMLSTIRDNALIIGQEAFTPMYDSFKNTIRRIRDASDNLRTALRTGGFGQVMEEMFPPRILNSIRLFVANLRMAKQNIQLFLAAIKPIVVVVGEYLLNAFNMVLPLLNAFGRILASAAYVLTSDDMFVRSLVGSLMGLFVVQGIIVVLTGFHTILQKLFIVKAITGLFTGLTKALSLFAKTLVLTPWVAIIAGIVAVLLYLALMSKTVSGALTKVGSAITKAFGVDPSKQFVPKMKKNTSTADEFNKSLGVSKESIDAMGKSAEDANKKAKKFLATFDEVFSPPELDEEEPKLDEELGNVIIPEVEIGEVSVPDVGEVMGPWIEKFKTTFGTKMKNTLAGMGLGAIIGGVIGGILGGPGGAIIGAKVGALAGGIAGWFWDMLPEKLQTLGGNAVTGTAIGMAVGAVIGGLLDGPAGALIGAAIGGVIGGLVGWFWEDLKNFFTSDKGKQVAVGIDIGGVIGALLGGLLGGPAGALIGWGIGELVGGIVGWFWDDLAAFFQTEKGKQTGSGLLIGGVIGSVIGGFIGGPVGALIGLGIGELVGGIVGWFWDDLAKYFQTQKGEQTAAGMIIGAVIGGVIGGFLLGPVGVLIGAGVGTLAGGIVGNFWTKLSDFFTTNKKAQAAAGIIIGTVIGAVIGGFLLGPVGVLIGGGIGALAGGIVSKFWSKLSSVFKTDKKNPATAGISIGTLIGAVIGAFLLGPVGALIGAGIGNLASGIVGNFWDDLAKYFKEHKDSGNSIATIICTAIGAFIGGLLGGPVGAIIGAGIGKLASGIVSQVWSTVTSAFSGGVPDSVTSAAESAASSSKNSKTTSIPKTGPLRGYASGGIITKDQYIRAGEGNKKEAIVPLENDVAMQPFSTAVANQVLQTLLPLVAMNSNPAPANEALRPLYVGTLVADDRSLKELSRKMDIITKQENERRGI